MARDPLPVLLRVRRLAQDAARRDLAEAVRAETAAVARLAEHDAGLAREAGALAAIDDDTLRAAYPTWLARARRERQGAQAGLDAATQHTGASRLQLADARAATRVVEALQARHDEARIAAERRAEQRTLDEAGRGRR